MCCLEMETAPLAPPCLAFLATLFNTMYDNSMPDALCTLVRLQESMAKSKLLPGTVMSMIQIPFLPLTSYTDFAVPPLYSASSPLPNQQ